MLKLSIFDLDKTLILGNSSFLFGSFLYRNHQMSFLKMIQLVAYYALYKAKVFSILEMQQKIFDEYFLGKDYAVIQKFAEQFVSENFDKLLNLPAVECLLLAQKEGQYTALLSSGPSFLVSIFAHRFKVNFWDATQYAVDKDQLFKISKSMLGKDKAQYLLKLAEELKIDRSDIAAYSDSIEDLPFLEVAGIPVGVNPDLSLLKVCKQNNWKIIYRNCC